LTRGGARTRLTSEGSNIFPLWSTDGASLYYSAFPSGSFDIYRVPADGGAPPELIVGGEFGEFATSLSPDGERLISVENNPITGFDLYLISLDGSGNVQTFLRTDADEAVGQISPDGRHMAYVSDESGREEIYIRPLDGDGGKITISTDGGSDALWSPNGDEIFYRNGDRMMRVPVQLDPSFMAGQPEFLFEGRYRHSYDVTNDARHFIMVTRAQPALKELNVVRNWSTELEGLVSTDN
jgi:serine/threonine-protein kinase